MFQKTRREDNFIDTHCTALRQVGAWNVPEKQAASAGAVEQRGEMSQRSPHKMPRGRLGYVRPHRLMYELVQRDPIPTRADTHMLPMHMFITTPVVKPYTAIWRLISHDMP